MEKLRSILNRKIQGVDCSEEESDEIKYWFRLVISYGGTVSEIMAINFPIEHAEVVEELSRTVLTT